MRLIILIVHLTIDFNSPELEPDTKPKITYLSFIFAQCGRLPLFLKKNMNASKSSEHRPGQGGKLSKRLVRWEHASILVYLHDDYASVQLATV